MSLTRMFSDYDIAIGVRTPSRVYIDLANNPDIHEGAEFPIVGAIASAAFFFSTISTNTSDFTERLKQRPRSDDIELATSDKEARVDDDSTTMLSSAQLEKLAQRMAHKVYEKSEKDNWNKAPVLHGPARLQQLRAARKAERGRARQIASATAHYVGDLAKTALKSTCRFEWTW